MSKWLNFTNHKLYQARLLLDQRDRVYEPVAMIDGLEQGALYLMYDAYRSYLNELAEIATYSETVDSLDQLLSVTPLVTGEMSELRMLKQDAFSWLSSFLNAVSNQGKPLSQQRSGVQQQAAIQMGMIPLSQEASSDARDWWQALSDLIDLQRQNHRES
ncbi:MAG: hypothetical protein P1U57_06005 [Oleibacter sp.]|nr:hypothetical protein [Thalassolituus sp.]